MNDPVSILLLEDNPKDAQLAAEVLAAEGIRATLTRVETRSAFEAALAQNHFDLVLSDYSLPSFDGLTALAVLRQRQPDLPFILVSGTLGEEVAVESLRAGANDYVLKHRINRLPQVVRRALNEARERQQRQAAERALRESRERYQALVETTFDWIWEVDAQARYTYSSPRVFTLLGYRPEEVVGRTPFDFMPEAEARRVKALYEQLAARREPFVQLVNTNRHRDGRLVVLESSAAPILAPDGTLLGYRGTDRDVTERQRAEEQLRKLAQVVEQSPISIMIADREGKLEFVNPRFSQATGYTPEEVRGRNPRFLKSGETPPEEYRRLWETITAGKEWRGEFHNKRKDGSLFWERAAISCIRDAAGTITHFLALKEDITEQKLTQAKLLRAQRVESIGCLASGIAHDLNNILTPIIMCAPMLQGEDLDPERREIVRTIEISAQRAVGIVKQLLSFARGREGLKQPVQLRHLVRDMAKIACETFPRSIQVEEVCDPKLWEVVGDPTQLHQVLLNLLVNARDAMPNGGTLTLRAGNVVLDESFVAMNPRLKTGPHIRLQVSDTGVGIPEEAKPHIFEAFYTTKGEGHGTGLGLTTVQGIVNDHQGAISFTSRVGHGTTFEILLPAAPASDSTPESPANPKSMPHGRGELILLVDDEPAICEATSRSLERHGYRCLRAQNGIAALAQFAAHQPQIRAVVTDYMMPQMDGVTLCRALRALSPQTPIVISSGGLFEKSAREALRAFEEMGIRHVLHKPHNADVLLEALAELLGHADAGQDTAAPQLAKFGEAGA